MSISETAWCWCGKKLDSKWGIFMCPRHKLEYFENPKKRQRVGRWSGPTRKFKGGYEND